QPQVQHLLSGREVGQDIIGRLTKRVRPHLTTRLTARDPVPFPPRYHFHSYHAILTGHYGRKMSGEQIGRRPIIKGLIRGDLSSAKEEVKPVRCGDGKRAGAGVNGGRGEESHRRAPTLSETGCSLTAAIRKHEAWQT